MEIHIPVGWMGWLLAFIGTGGVFLGLLSYLWPRKSIKLYQAMMMLVRWYVEPMSWEQELRNTKALGLLMILVSTSIFGVMLLFWL